MPNPRSQESSDLTKYLSLGAAGISAPLLYKYLRTARFSADPILRQIQQTAAGNYSRTLHAAEPRSAIHKALNKYLYDADTLHYLGGEGGLFKEAPRAPKRTPGTTYLMDPGDAKYVQGTSTVGKLSDPAAAKMEALSTDKWKEYQYLEKYAPGSLPKTENLQNILKELKIKGGSKGDPSQLKMLQQLEVALKKRYPQGFILKPTSGSQSAGIFPSEKHDFKNLYSEYLNQGLDKGLKDFNKSTNRNRDWARLRKQPGFAGRVLDQAIRNPARVIVQHKLPLENVSLPGKLMSTLTNRPMTKELRVHVVNGRVVPDLVGPRYFHPLMGITDHKMLESAGNYAQGIMDKLPPQHRGNFALDVAPLQGGGFTLIESNPGGASGMLHPQNSLLNTWKLRKAMTGSYGPAAAATGAFTGAAAIGGAAALAPTAYGAVTQQMPDTRS